MFKTSLLFGILAVTVACGGSEKEPAHPEPRAAPEPAPAPAPASAPEPATTFADQVALGGELYGENCAGCHGDAGQGTERGPRVVGDGALPLEPHEAWPERSVTFRTGLDVFEYVSANMPKGDPGSLEAAEYVAILAFALKANGVELDRPLDAEVAAGFVLNEE